MIRRSYLEVKERAMAELWLNPTISVYRFVDGVEHRYPAYPYDCWRRAFRRLDIHAAYARLGQAFVEIIPAVEKFCDRLVEAIGAIGGLK
jgi:hypothetical protein